MNREEAKAVAEVVDRSIPENGGSRFRKMNAETLGVITLNAEQQSLILDSARRYSPERQRT